MLMIASSGPAGAQVAGEPTEPSLAKALPVAAGALAEGATTVFVLPLLIPCLACAAVGTPALGAVVRARIGYA
jgi:hypothetical protein